MSGEPTEPATAQEGTIIDVSGKTRDNYHDRLSAVHVRETIAAIFSDDMSEIFLDPGACVHVFLPGYRPEVVPAKADGDSQAVSSISIGVASFGIR